MRGPTSVCNFGEKQNCFIYNICLSLITKVIINKCNSDSDTNICNYSTSSDSVCLWRKKKSQSAPRGTKQLNFCWETEHKTINIWLVALILNNCVKAIRAICRELNTSNVGLESHYQTGMGKMGWRWDCVKKSAY